MNTQQSSEQPDSMEIGRRNLLKAIGATGLAVAATTSLPGEWAKPVMDLGLLAAHAQTSVPTTVPPTPTPCIVIPTPADILLSVDVSGSGVEGLGNIKSALTTFIGARDLTKDKIGLVSFDTGTLIAQSLTQDVIALDYAINLLFGRGGSTSIAYGIGAAQNLLEADPTSGNQEIIVLFSDGAANRTDQSSRGGEASPEATAAAIAAAQIAKAAGIRIISVAVGTNTQSASDLMRSVASSAGDFFNTANLAELVEVLVPDCQP